MRINLEREDIDRLNHSLPIRPHRVKFQLTNACNARCQQCNLYKIKPQMLSANAIDSTLEMLGRMDCREVDFTGGEPTLHPGLISFFEKANQLGFKIKMNSNGYLVDTVLAETITRLGLREFAISIDSHNPIKHNQQRRLDDSWQKAIAAIQNIDRFRNLYQTGTRIVLYSIIDNRNYLDTPRVLDLKEIANFDEINFIPIKNPENHAQFLSEQQLGEFYQEVRPALLERYKKYKLKGIFRTIDDPFEVLSSAAQSDTSGGLYTEAIYNRIACRVPSFYAYVVSDGSVVPCCVAPHHLEPGYIMGNINETPFDIIWNSERFNSFRKSLLKPSYLICKCCSGHHTAFNIDIDNQLSKSHGNS